MPKIDVARLNALRPRPKPSDNSPEAIRRPSDDAADPVEVDRVPMGRTLRKRKEKVAKHLKRRANEKERESLQKRVFRIPLEKPFEEAYFTHRLWMFFRETEEDIMRMFCEARKKMKKRITLKKKSDPGQFAIPYQLGLQVEPSRESFTFVDCSQRSSGGIVRDLEVQIGNALVPVDFHVLDIKLNWNSSLLLRRAFLSTSRSHRRPPEEFDGPELVAACHCGAEYETEYSASIETHTATSIDSARQKSNDTTKEESVDSSPKDWENDYYNPTMAAHTKDIMQTEEYDEDYEKERAIEYKAILDEEDRLLHHSSWKRNVPSIDRTVSTSINTHPHQTSRKRASTDVVHFSSIDTGVDRELLNMQRRDEADQQRAEAIGERTHLSHPIDRSQPNIDRQQPTVDRQQPSIIDRHPSKTKIHYGSSFTQTKLVPEIYTKDEINEMFYGVCGAQEKNVDIDKIQHAADKHRPASIDRHHSTSIDDDSKNSHPMKSQPDFHTRRDQLGEEIYRILETTEERLDRRCDDIYFPMDLSMSTLTSQIEVIQRELVEIQSYIARRPEASASIDRRNNKSTDIHRHTSVDGATNRGRLVPKVTSDMSDAHNHGKEISSHTYATLMRHQFNLESLGDRLQKIENTTATMKEKWHRGDEAMRDFTDCLKELKLTSNTKLDTTACLGAWYTWDQILQTSLEDDVCFVWIRSDRRSLVMLRRRSMMEPLVCSSK
ncbi:hypothetical protein F2Q68_00039138 [Brassica cretica]|uniref:Uncharacterized protein n=1 Tax=Brassica cretica TaxID=69181 RepID=A0A8S9MD84_BRACR|nr:hypothetical protein F2Q68_00039138 [Brassica cretica]